MLKMKAASQMAKPMAIVHRGNRIERDNRGMFV
jgi:hypothetical protein